MRVAILGQGIAGTLVHAGLAARGVRAVVFDLGHARAASRAAAGIVNPVTGRRFVLTWRADQLLRGLETYAPLERLLGRRLVHPLTVLRDLSAVPDRNQWDLRCAQPDYAGYLGAPRAAGSVGGFSASGYALPGWLGPTLRARRVDLPGLIAAYRTHLGRERLLRETELPAEPWRREDGGWFVAAEPFDAVVDCRGYGARAASAWAPLPWRGSKGEALRFADAGFPRDFAVKRRHFVCPVGDASDLWLGGTATDRFDDDASTPSAREQLWMSWRAHRGLDSDAAADPVLPEGEHLSAIRPTTRDRRPLVGEHPRHQGLWLCNGLGTKGGSLAPLAAAQLIAALLDGEPVDEEVALVGRFRENVH